MHHSTVHECSRYRIDIIYSLEDRGYYAEVIDSRTGKNLHVTEVVRLESTAENDAIRWIEGREADAADKASSIRYGF